MRLKARINHKVSLEDPVVVNPLVTIGKIVSCVPEPDSIYFTVEIETDKSLANLRIIDGLNTQTPADVMP